MKPSRLDQPEIHMAVFGFLTAFVWEMWQMPFYQMDDTDYFAMARTCTFASMGDAVLMVIAYSAVSAFNRSRLWLIKPRVWQVTIYLAIGLLVTVGIEDIATRSAWGWQYSTLMPNLPGSHIALIPLVMWVAIPLTALWFARRQPLYP